MKQLLTFTVGAMAGLLVAAIITTSTRTPEPLHLEQAIGNNPYSIVLAFPYNSPELQAYARQDDNFMDIIDLADLPQRKDVVK